MSTVDTMQDTTAGAGAATGFKENRKQRERVGQAFHVILVAATLFGLLMLAFLISDVIYESMFFRMPGDHVVVEGQVSGNTVEAESIRVVDPVNRLQSESRSRTAGLVGVVTSFDPSDEDDQRLFLTINGEEFSIRIEDAELPAAPDQLVDQTVLAVGARNGPSILAADEIQIIEEGSIVGMVDDRTTDRLELTTPQGPLDVTYSENIDVEFIGLSERQLEEALEENFNALGFEEIEELDADTLQRVAFNSIDPTLSFFRSEIVTEFPSRRPSEAGMLSGIVGSVIVITLTALFSFPLGVGAAVYLEEYAPKNWLTSFIQINLNNLAGVPSIVYGMLGLALFVRMFGIFRPDSWLVNTFNIPITDSATGGWAFNLFGLPFLPMELPLGRSLLAGGLTMTLLILPVVIIAAREAIRAVPPSIREAAYGLGATKWQVVSRQVLPIAMPGILTGMILALSRAIGETAPLIIMGAFTFVPFLPESIWDQFTVMPIQIYNWITLPQQEFQIHLAASGIIILLVVMLSMNAIAIFLRRQFEIKW
jgi:phosphate transport system permease protein